MRDKNKIQKARIKKFFKVFGESFITVTEITAAIVFVLALVGLILLVWGWGINKATAHNNPLYLLVSVMITMIFFAIIATLDKL